mmetsp:Transcript_47385/g.138153  ORF Transcript_47385/g.138153 Transcript_47385/m.138153 type:complete len:220 (-) Transcript_47385:988-1647(-)
MRGATKSSATSSRASARGKASARAASPSSTEGTSMPPGQAVCTSKNWTPSVESPLPTGWPSRPSTSGASLCRELSLSSSMSLARLMPVVGRPLLVVSGRSAVPQRVREAVLRRPVEPMFREKPPVEPRLDSRPLAPSCCAPVPGREPLAAVPRRVEVVVGRVDVVPGLLAIFACAKACSCATAFSAISVACPPAPPSALIKFAASLRTSPLRCSAALTA